MCNLWLVQMWHTLFRPMLLLYCGYWVIAGFFFFNKPGAKEGSSADLLLPLPTITRLSFVTGVFHCCHFAGRSDEVSLIASEVWVWSFIMILRSKKAAAGHMKPPFAAWLQNTSTPAWVRDFCSGDQTVNLITWQRSRQLIHEESSLNH